MNAPAIWMKWLASSVPVLAMPPEFGVVAMMSGREKWYEPANMPAAVARLMFWTKYGSSYRCERLKNVLSFAGYPPWRWYSPVVPPRLERMKTNWRFSTFRMLFHVVCEMFPCQAETSSPSSRLPLLCASAALVIASIVAAAAAQINRHRVRCGESMDSSPRVSSSAASMSPVCARQTSYKVARPVRSPRTC